MTRLIVYLRFIGKLVYVGEGLTNVVRRKTIVSIIGILSTSLLTKYQTYQLADSKNVIEKNFEFTAVYVDALGFFYTVFLSQVRDGYASFFFCEFDYKRSREIKKNARDDKIAQVLLDQALSKLISIQLPVLKMIPN